MSLLKILYENPPKKREFFPRKVSITAIKTILCGPSKCGKSSIIIDYLSNFAKEKMLYIDFSDLRVDALLTKSLQDFIDLNFIDIVVLEHFDYQCDIPQAKEVVLSSIKPLYIDGYITTFVHTLDFEEFISFEKKHQNIEHTFSNFTNFGTYPSVILGHEEARHRYIQSMLLEIVKNQNAIFLLKILSNYQSEKISIIKIHEKMKEHIKISKDVTYSIIERLQNESFIHLVEKFLQPKSNKKFYFTDFAVKNALTFEKNFLKRFENIVFSELIKKELKIFYTEFIDFYIPSKNIAIVCIPFLPPELIKRRFAKIKKELLHLNIKTLHVITVGNEGNFTNEGIKCDILPFWEWAMR